MARYLLKQHRFVAELLGQLGFVFRDVDKPQCVVTNSKPLLCSKGGVVAGECLPGLSAIAQITCGCLSFQTGYPMCFAVKYLLPMPTCRGTDIVV